MHIPTIGQVATIGLVFIAATALAVPIVEPRETDIVENSADLVARGEGISAIANSVHALEQRTSKKKCKRNKKGKCDDSDSDDDYKKNKKCKRTKKGKCIDSDSDDDDKKNKSKNCKRNKKGNCIDSDDDKNNGGKADDKNNGGKADDKNNGGKADDKNNGGKADDKNNGY
ncbi:uncharacterized protein GLRG_11207 [Colletotrichum graminicola M1.001]|uniref:Uncharacterized protein n=1 Tax=Colletotrichum graminicola (strain M1.001 / M2 / FGSC 10212) TaxID=645133 RepID=E3QYX5_COLGM|nr:uncharacterized protein GLRG_11207 [Colletotrichum graminicola M1.001]EFQ36063.1 hypothetical protein GLRG_11207 [Colletotrichum graminicola M1.001]